MPFFLLKNFLARSKLSLVKTFFNIIPLPQLSMCMAAAQIFKNRPAGIQKKKKKTSAKLDARYCEDGLMCSILLMGNLLCQSFFVFLCQCVFCWFYLVQFSGGKFTSFYWQTSKLVSFSSREFDAMKPGVQLFVWIKWLMACCVAAICVDL